MKNMLLLKNKTLPSIGLTLLLSMMLIISCMCFAVAQTSGEVNTNLHVVAFPNPVGVGQDVVVTFQLDKTSPTAAGVAGGDHFTNFMVTITKPDGTTEMKGPYTASAISGNYLMYTPTEAGKYTFKANFPGQWINVSATERYWYKPAESAVFELTVQQDPVLPYPDIELPTDYWTRPINAENKGWWQIADNWLMVGYDYNLRTFTVSSAFAPYTSAPDSAHVLWKKPIVFGGMVGGPFSDTAYYTGLSYEQHYNPLVLNGRIIYTEHYPTSSASHSVFGTRCVDLYTGEEIWNLDGKNIAFAQILQFDSPNEHGAIPHLWSTSGTATNNTWIMYDAFTGKQMLTITNITMGSSDRWGTVRFGPNGELLTYTITGSSDARRIILWNSTKALVTPSAAGVAEYYSPVAGSVIDGRRGIEWNVSIPPMTQGTELIAQISGGYILTSNWTASSARMGFAYEQRAYPATIERLSDGSYPDSINYLWSESRDVYMAAYKFSKINEGIYTMFDEGRLQHFAYDIKTGHELWRTEPLEPGWAMFSGYNTHIAYGKLYASGYDGYVRAYDITSGNQVWEYFYGSAGYETPYGTWPTYAGFNIADGKIYVTNDDHSPDSVIWRGGKLHVINAHTGEGVWNISGWMRHGAISDGIYTSINSLDGQVYTFGKGPSAITVQTPLIAVPESTAITITGTITDQSPGQTDTPCISDQDMAAWMEYLHMQKPKPANATGVPIRLQAVASNGHIIDIATVNSNIYGTFGYKWVPPTKDTYLIVATFDGTNSYGSSTAATYLSVDQPSAALPTPSPTEMTIPTQTPITTATISPTSAPQPEGGIPTETLLIIVAAIIIIIVVATAAVLLKRR